MKKSGKSFVKKPAVLLTAAALLLAGSTIGSTRAALTYYSENYSAEVTVSSIGVGLTENGETVGSRYYDPDRDEWRTEGDGVLLKNLVPEGEKFLPGREYPERLAVTNRGDIEAYVRVVLRRSWLNSTGTKRDTQLDPALIDLHLTGDGWVVDGDASTPERMVLYYTRPVAPGKATSDLCDTLRVDPAITTKVKRTSETVDAEGRRTYTIEYAYDGYQMSLEAETDAVQANSAKAAIKSAWGVDVDIDGSGNLSLL